MCALSLIIKWCLGGAYRQNIFWHSNINGKKGVVGHQSDRNKKSGSAAPAGSCYKKFSPCPEQNRAFPRNNVPNWQFWANSTRITWRRHQSFCGKL